MRVALLTDGVHPIVVGGMQKHSLFLAQHLTRNRVMVDLIHAIPEGKDFSTPLPFSEAEQAYIQEIRIPFRDQGKLPGHYLRACHRYSQAVFAAIQAILPKVDVIYAQGFSAWATLEARKKGANIPPVCINFHGLNMFQQTANWKDRLRQRMFLKPVRFHFKEADFLQSLGGTLTEILLKEGVNQERIWEIPIGIDDTWIRSHPSNQQKIRTFVFIGRYERLKGIEELTQVIQHLLQKENVEFQMDFIGPIPTEKQVASPAVRYHGTLVDTAQIQALLDQADALVCPSYSEGMPTVILEAMSRHCVIIASDVGAVREQVSNANGWLIPPADLPALQQAMEQVISLSDQELLHKKQASLKRVSERFLWSKVAETTISHFERILAPENVNTAM